MIPGCNLGEWMTVAREAAGSVLFVLVVFAVWPSIGAVVLVCFFIPLICLIACFAKIADKPTLSFIEMDSEALISLDNARRARVQSETGHLPPRLCVSDSRPSQ